MLAAHHPVTESCPASTKRLRRPSQSELRSALVAFAPELFARALRLSRNPAVAEDLVQDTVERAMRFESHFIPGTNARAWLFQILFSVFITRCRRARREQKALGSLAADPCAWTTPDGIAPTMSRLTPALAAQLAQLPDAFRRAVELVDLEELSYKDAADRMGVPVGTVMSRLHRGRKLLASALTEGEVRLAA
ncbi:MAG: sigma-70 family RNA polymerase sigma factor [Polyangiaceae bacterium]|jgi:RNA polymerase sigma-70 factor (ECF subfamily)|nr:sigma-70 family RNA polymerase sigma factor [Polyangiaceae bacterium]MBK8943255.1 sigma-70 family RNA polymerase sigma factor [Polyangiaceae bacterium]